MICKNCGAPLSIEEEKCPYCGTSNPAAQKHAKELARIQFSALKKIRAISQKSRRIVLLCMMIVLLIVSFVFLGLSWEIGSAVTKWQASANHEKYSAILDQYEKDGDFLSFAALYDQKYLYGSDEFEEYRHVYTAASNYSNIYRYISTLLEEEHWEDGHKNALESLCESLDYHYKYIEREPYEWYYDIGAYDEQHLDAVERINEKIENLLKLTFSISEEEMREFKELSPAEKQVFIERRVKENE